MPRAQIICDNCGKNPALDTGWFCDPCTEGLLKTYASSFEGEGQADEDLCTDCESAPATLFGICDDCYDEAYNTRNGGRKTGDSHAWWNRESTPPATVPDFAAEVTHHSSLKRHLKEAAVA